MQLHNLPDRHKTALQDLADMFDKNPLPNNPPPPTISNNTTKPISKTATIPFSDPPQSTRPDIIPYKPEEIAPPSIHNYQRPPTHNYNTRSKQTPHVINNIIKLKTPTYYTSAALQKLTAQTLTSPWPFHQIMNVMDDASGEMLNYEKLIKNPDTRKVWSRAMCKELGRLSQGFDSTEGTNTFFFLTRNEIKNIPKDKTVTYARIVANHRPQKSDPFRIRLTAGGNLLFVPGDISTKTADLTTSKILWNSVLSTPNAKYAVIDIHNMYLQTPMFPYEYMKIPIQKIPKEFMDAYDLHNKVHNGHIYCEIRKGMYGLPQAGKIANDLLKTRLEEIRVQRNKIHTRFMETQLTTYTIHLSSR